MNIKVNPLGTRNEERPLILHSNIHVQQHRSNS